eukprot:10396762-Alexandrium_andersonii.AAC.1
MPPRTYRNADQVRPKAAQKRSTLPQPSIDFDVSVCFSKDLEPPARSVEFERRWNCGASERPTIEVR